MNIGFIERYRRHTEWEEIQKSLSHKYIRRYPKKSGKGWNYVYEDSWKHPFKALLECFGIKKAKVEKDFTANNINKDYGVDKETFAAHVLEYFTNKVKWDNLFSKKEKRDKYKKPETQKEVTERLQASEKAPKEKKNGDKMVVNRSLMRKVWTLYSVAGQRAEAEETDAEKQAAKDGVFTDDKESEAEAHENRSQAMMGNQNAEKLFSDMTDEEKRQKKEQVESNIVSSIPKDSVPYNGDGKYGKAAKEWIEKKPRNRNLCKHRFALEW